jgi:hypothetical protein
MMKEVQKQVSPAKGELSNIQLEVHNAQVSNLGLKIHGSQSDLLASFENVSAQD